MEPTPRFGTEKQKQEQKEQEKFDLHTYSPLNVLRKHKINIFDWKEHYSKRDKIFNKIWPDMENCIYELEAQMLICPFRVPAIKQILYSWFPDIYLVVKPSDKEFKANKKQEIEKLIKKNESGL